MKQFSTSLGRSVTVITILVVAILITVAVTLVTTLPNLDTPKRLLIGSLPLLSIVIGYLFRVSRISASPNAIRVHRIIRPFTIPVDARCQIEKAPDLMKGSLRTFGNGGLFGYYGRFWKPGLGSFRAYVTNPANTLMLRTQDRIYALSPDQPDAFIEAMKPQPPPTS